MEFKATRPKGSYVYLACDFCQKRKIRCVLKDGLCQACSARGLVCTYENPTRRNRLRNQYVGPHHWDTSSFPAQNTNPSPELPPSLELPHYIKQPNTRIEPRPPRTSCDPNDMFLSRSNEISPDEIRAITTAFYNTNSKLLTHVRDNMPQLIQKSTHAEFRFVIDIVMASIHFQQAFDQRFQLKNPHHKMPENALSYYSRAVAYLPSLETHTMFRNVLQLLDVLRHQATALFLAMSFRCL